MDMRDRRYRRIQRARHIRRKVNIVKHVYRDYVPIPGKFAKGKVHCSCPLCAFSGLTMSDRRKIGHIEAELAELADIA